jgi:hypothetical protein
MKRLLFAGITLLAFSLTGVPAASAKPADLPVEHEVQCGGEEAHGKVTIGLDFLTGRITVKVEAAPSEPTPAIDALLPACVEQMVSHLGDFLARPDRFVNLDMLLSKLPQLGAAPDAKRPPAEPAVKSGDGLEFRLFEPASVKIKDVPLQQALKNLGKVSGVRIVPDYQAFKDARVDLNTPVSLAVENTSVHAALQQLVQPLRLTYEIEDGVVKVTTVEKSMYRMTPAQRQAKANEPAAQRVFEMAERSRRAGDYEKARVGYQRVHLLTPTSVFGRMAIVRIEEMEERMRETSEEQGGPGRSEEQAPEEIFRDMQNRSVPLGLVNVSY